MRTEIPDDHPVQRQRAGRPCGRQVRRNPIDQVVAHGGFGLSADERQHRPYRPLAETFAEYNLPPRRDIGGMLACSHCPQQLAGINFVGPHFHFLSADHAHGGHVTGWTLEHGTIEVCEAISLPLNSLPTPPGRRPECGAEGRGAALPHRVRREQRPASPRWP
jgi:hypothetical protein